MRLSFGAGRSTVRGPAGLVELAAVLVVVRRGRHGIVYISEGGGWGWFYADFAVQKTSMSAKRPLGVADPC